MRKLKVSIEIEGKEQFVGNIVGNNSEDACFGYAEYYIENIAKPISISFPIQKEVFSPQQTKTFFEGLLPEGFSRKAVAAWMHTDENDYLTILGKLGQECIGALRVIEEETDIVETEYVRLTQEKVKALAAEGATKSTEILLESHLSLTGASGKVGLYYDSDENVWYQPKGDAPSTHIVKQSHIRLDKLVINEQLCLQTAKKMGIEIPDSFIIDVGNGKDDDILFATKRYDRLETSDRILSGVKCPYRLHQEDFAQALGIPSSEKYEKNNVGYMKKMFECIRRYSVSPIEDQMKLWDRIIFNYLVGNTDGHLKNFSLVYNKTLSGIRLAPAYDIVSTRIYGLTKNMSFAIGGNYNIDEISRNSFKIAAGEVGLGENMALDRFDYLKEIFAKSISEAAEEMEDNGLEGVMDIKNRIFDVLHNQ